MNHSGPKSDLSGCEIFIEFVVQGNFVKVTAIDSVTGVEASIVGPAGAAREALALAAGRKLKYVLEKKPPED